MNQPTAQIIYVQFQNNNIHPQRLQNIGGRHNGNSQLQNIPNSTSIAIQHYVNLVEGTNPFARTQCIENSPPQNTSSSLISGLSSHKYGYEEYIF